MLENIIELLKSRQYAKLKVIVNDLNEADISEILDELSKENAAILFRLLDKDIAADVFSRMENDTQELLMEALTNEEIHEISSQLFVDDVVDIVSELPSNLVTKLLRNTDPSKRRIVNELLKYPEDSAGSIMTTEFVDLTVNMMVSEAFEWIRKIGFNKETIYTCYVIDEKRKLVGVTAVKDMIFEDKNTLISEFMEDQVITVNTHDDREDVVHMFDKYDFLAMPVVDKENRLVGIITVDDAMDVMSEESEEDFEIMAAMSPSEDSYFKTSVFEHTKNRIVWLLVLMLSSTITGMIITHYQDAFASLPILVSFIPMLMDTGGNCGSQSSTMIIRGLATKEIEFKDIFKVWFKEVRIALLVGICLALVNGVRIMIQYRNPLLAVLIGITLMCTVVLAKSLGCILPMLADKLHLDPAIMASPMITTICDACSTLIYFNVATFLFSI